MPETETAELESRSLLPENFPVTGAGGLMKKTGLYIRWMKTKSLSCPAGIITMITESEELHTDIRTIKQHRFCAVYPLIYAWIRCCFSDRDFQSCSFPEIPSGINSSVRLRKTRILIHNIRTGFSGQRIRKILQDIRYIAYGMPQFMKP